MNGELAQQITHVVDLSRNVAAHLPAESGHTLRELADMLDKVAERLVERPTH